MSARLARAAAIGVALAFASLAGTWGLLFARPLPTIDGYYRMLGLHERGEIVRDVFGIPHVYASDAHDLFFLQGYVTAQDRLVEMERLRETARATVHLPIDAELASAPAAFRETLDAYAAGVTKLIRQLAEAGSLPGELVLAGRRPPDWTAGDSIAVAGAFLGSPGSRCVAASARGSAKGSPLLAARLDFDGPAPGLYEIGLAGADVRAVGISLPGVPGIVAGHDGWVAWAVLGAERSAPTSALAALLGWMSATRIDDAFVAPVGLGLLDACAADVRGVRAGTFTDATPPADPEAMRLALGPPTATVGARLVVDLSDVHTARSVVSHGASGQPASAHFEDQAPLWEAGLLHALQYSRPPERRVDGDLVLRAR